MFTGGGIDHAFATHAEQKLHAAVALKFVLELPGKQAASVPRALHDRAAQGGFTSHEQSNASQALIADDRDFRRSAVRQSEDEHSDRGGKHDDHRDADGRSSQPRAGLTSGITRVTGFLRLP